MKNQYKFLYPVVMSPLAATYTSFLMGFIIFVSSCRDTASQYDEGRNISVSCLRYSANHNTLNSWPIRAHLASQNDEFCKNRHISERNDDVQYEENNVVFFTLNNKHCITPNTRHMTPLNICSAVFSFINCPLFFPFSMASPLHVFPSCVNV